MHFGRCGRLDSEHKVAVLARLVAVRAKHERPFGAHLVEHGVALELRLFLVALVADRLGHELVQVEVAVELARRERMARKARQRHLPGAPIA